MAGEPVAIVEDVSMSGAGVAFMDYLEAGQTIALGGNGRITIGYLRSCMREIVTGGTVTVGDEQSQVDGGEVVRERVECDGGKLELTVEQAGKSTVMVLRTPPDSPGSMSPRPAFTIYGTSPVLRPYGSAREIVVERVDRPSEILRLAMTEGFVDMSTRGLSLVAGGLYRARAGDRAVTFKVDSYAQPGPGPLIGRLVSF
jgi:hypothetical protein